MTRRWKRLLFVLAVVVLGGGGLAWWWQATAVDRQVSALLDEVRTEPPAVLHRLAARHGFCGNRCMQSWREA